MLDLACIGSGLWTWGISHSHSPCIAMESSSSCRCSLHTAGDRSSWVLASIYSFACFWLQLGYSSLQFEKAASCCQLNLKVGISLMKLTKNCWATLLAKFVRFKSTGSDKREIVYLPLVIVLNKDPDEKICQDRKQKAKGDFMGNNWYHNILLPIM